LPKPKKMSLIQDLLFRVESTLEVVLSSRFINKRIVFLLKRLNIGTIMKLLQIT
jgi:hypothetical protein